MSYLIIGGNLDDRQQKALEMAKNQFHASTFDTIINGSLVAASEAPRLIVGETSIGIGQIRDLGHQLSLKPYNSEVKVAIIHPGEILTLEAQNALLKTLEEPNASSILILTAPQTDFLLPTIVSRCQIIRLESKQEMKLSNDDIVALLHCCLVALSNGVGERLKFASTFKNKDEIKDWLTKMLFALHESLLRPHHPEDFNCHSERSEESLANASGANKLRDSSASSLRMTPLQIVEIIRSLGKTRSLLDQNINHKLALEIFLLELPFSKSPDVRS